MHSCCLVWVQIGACLVAIRSSAFTTNRCTSININMVGFGVHNILSAQERTIGDALVAGTTLWTSTAGVRSYTRKWSPVPYDAQCHFPMAVLFLLDMDEVPMPAFVPAFEGDKPVIGRAMRSRLPLSLPVFTGYVCFGLSNFVWQFN